VTNRGDNGASAPAADAQAVAMVQEMAQVVADMAGAEPQAAFATVASELTAQSQLDSVLGDVVDPEAAQKNPVWGVTVFAPAGAELNIVATKRARPGESIDEVLKRTTIMALVVNPVCRALLRASGWQIRFWQSPKLPESPKQPMILLPGKA